MKQRLRKNMVWVGLRVQGKDKKLFIGFIDV